MTATVTCTLHGMTHSLLVLILALGLGACAAIGDRPTLATARLGMPERDLTRDARRAIPPAGVRLAPVFSQSWIVAR